MNSDGEYISTAVLSNTKNKKGIFTMQEFKIEELTPHPRNDEFFDDIVGEKWKELLESVKKRIDEGKRGNIEPIIVTQDKVIVSGHQRVRAFKELGIPTIWAEVKHYNSEDEILLDLLESNIRRRGDVDGSSRKMGRRVAELERLYGIQNGASSFQGNQYHEVVPNNSEAPKTQEQLAAEMGFSVDTLQNYKLLSQMIPELAELVDTGIVTKTTALAIMRNLSEEDQIDLISNMDTTKKITQKVAQQYIDRFNYIKEHPELPADYEDIKRQLKNYKSDYQRLKEDFDQKVKELQEFRTQMENIKQNDPAEQYSKKLKDSTLLFCSKIATFIEQVGGYIWLTDEINKIPELEREGYIKSVHAIKAWADTMEYNINNKIKEIN